MSEKAVSLDYLEATATAAALAAVGNSAPSGWPRPLRSAFEKMEACREEFLAEMEGRD